MERIIYKTCYGDLGASVEKHTIEFLETNTPCKFHDVKLPNRIGKWSAIDTAYLTFKGNNYSQVFIMALFEHNYYGDETPMILCFYDVYNLAWVELTETYDDMFTSLYDLEIVDN